MKKIKDKSKMYMILGISFLVLAVLGSTYAYYKYVIATINVDTITRGLDYYINYTKGTDITSAALNPGSDYTSGNNLSVTLYKKDNTYTIYGHIYIDISSISDGLSNSGALKYTVLEGTTKITSGQLTGTTSGDTVPLAVNIPLKTASTKYTVYLWFDETEENYMSAENTSISATVRCEASMKPIKGTSYGTTGKYFYNKYTPNTKVINNGITYNYDTRNSLMQDVGGNLRYYGASPNNYIYFNCSDYSNQSSSTCETWRIIGVFNGKLKLIRGSQIGTYSWDNKNTSTGAEDNDGKNDWTDARLMKLLNPGYETETTGGSLYYNSGSGNCYAGQNNATKACDFTVTGIKNNKTRGLISEETYSLLGWDNSEVYSNQMYEYEKSTGSVYTGRPTSWIGKIALAYPSDYGYAADLGKCTKTLFYYRDSTCTSNNWMKSMMTSHNWLLTPFSGDSGNVWNIRPSGYVYYYDNYPYVASGVTPVLYLNPEIGVKGTGSSSAPYQISA